MADQEGRKKKVATPIAITSPSIRKKRPKIKLSKINELGGLSERGHNLKAFSLAITDQSILGPLRKEAANFTSSKSQTTPTTPTTPTKKEAPSSEILSPRFRALRLRSNSISNLDLAVNIKEKIKKPEKTTIKSSISICVLGHPGSGKTQLIESIFKYTIKEKEPTKVKEGISSYQGIFQISSKKRKKFQIHEINNEKSLISNANIFIILIDVNNLNSIQTAVRITNEIQFQNKNSVNQLKIVYLINKIDEFKKDTLNMSKILNEIFVLSRKYSCNLLSSSLLDNSLKPFYLFSLFHLIFVQYKYQLFIEKYYEVNKILPNLDFNHAVKSKVSFLLNNQIKNNLENRNLIFDDFFEIKKEDFLLISIFNPLTKQMSTSKYYSVIKFDFLYLFNCETSEILIFYLRVCKIKEKSNNICQIITPDQFKIQIHLINDYFNNNLIYPSISSHSSPTTLSSPNPPPSPTLSSSHNRSWLLALLSSTATPSPAPNLFNLFDFLAKPLHLESNKISFSCFYNIATRTSCVDCNDNGGCYWVSRRYGTFLCNECATVHRELKLSKITKIHSIKKLKNLWTLLRLHSNIEFNLLYEYLLFNPSTASNSLSSSGSSNTPAKISIYSSEEERRKFIIDKYQNQLYYANASDSLWMKSLAQQDETWEEIYLEIKSDGNLIIYSDKNKNNILHTFPIGSCSFRTGTSKKIMKKKKRKRRNSKKAVTAAMTPARHRRNQSTAHQASNDIIDILKDDILESVPLTNGREERKDVREEDTEDFPLLMCDEYLHIITSNNSFLFKLNSPSQAYFWFILLQNTYIRLQSNYNSSYILFKSNLSASTPSSTVQDSSMHLLNNLFMEKSHFNQLNKLIQQRNQLKEKLEKQLEETLAEIEGLKQSISISESKINSLIPSKIKTNMDELEKLVGKVKPSTTGLPQSITSGLDLSSTQIPLVNLSSIEKKKKVKKNLQLVSTPNKSDNNDVFVKIERNKSESPLLERRKEGFESLKTERASDSIRKSATDSPKVERKLALTNSNDSVELNLTSSGGSTGSSNEKSFALRECLNQLPEVKEKFNSKSSKIRSNTVTDKSSKITESTKNTGRDKVKGKKSLPKTGVTEVGPTEDCNNIDIGFPMSPKEIRKSISLFSMNTYAATTPEIPSRDQQVPLRSSSPPPVTRSHHSRRKSIKNQKKIEEKEKEVEQQFEQAFKLRYEKEALIQSLDSGILLLNDTPSHPSATVSVKGGTLNTLIKQLAIRSNNSEYVDIFLKTFPAFADCNEFLSIFCKLFAASNSNLFRNRILEILEIWITRFWNFDFLKSPLLVIELVSFLDRIVCSIDELSSKYESLKNLIINHFNNSGTQPSTPTSTPIPFTNTLLCPPSASASGSHPPLLSAHNHFLSTPTNEMAKHQLSNYHATLPTVISPHNFLSQSEHLSSSPPKYVGSTPLIPCAGLNNVLPPCLLVLKSAGIQVNQIVNFLLESDATDIAKQLSLMHHDLFATVQPRELLGKKWTTPNRETETPNIHQLTDKFNKLSQWISTSLLQQTKLKSRIKLLEKFIMIAIRCRELFNFHALISILGGLQDPSIQRCAKTWHGVSQKLHNHFVNLLNVISINENWANYRRLITECQSTNVPCVPYIGIYLKDLVFLEDGLPDLIAGYPPNMKVINFEKYRKVSDVISEVVSIQQKTYNFNRSPLIGACLDAATSVLPLLNEKDRFDQSKIIEPKQTNQNSIGKNASAKK